MKTFFFCPLFVIGGWGCWEIQCKIALKEKVLGKMAKGQKYPGIVY